MRGRHRFHRARRRAPGDRLVLTLTVQTRAERPCSRYAQVAVTVA